MSSAGSKRKALSEPSNETSEQSEDNDDGDAGGTGEAAMEGEDEDSTSASQQHEREQREEHERLERKRERNAYHGRKKREQDRIEIETLRSRCQSLSAENLAMYHQNKRLQTRVEKVKGALTEHIKNPHFDLSRALIEAVHMPLSSSEPIPLEHKQKINAEIFSLAEELKKVDNQIKLLKQKNNLSPNIMASVSPSVIMGSGGVATGVGASSVAQSAVVQELGSLLQQQQLQQQQLQRLTQLSGAASLAPIIPPIQQPVAAPQQQQQQTTGASSILTAIISQLQSSAAQAARQTTVERTSATTSAARTSTSLGGALPAGQLLPLAADRPGAGGGSCDVDNDRGDSPSSDKSGKKEDSKASSTRQQRQSS